MKHGAALHALLTSRPPCADESSLPLRQISRIANEMHFSGMGLIHRTLPQPFDRSILLLLILRVCAPDWASGRILRRPDTPTRFVSVNSIASSLHRPFETVRRQVRALVDSGLCVAHPSGVALNPDPAVAPVLLALYASYNDLVVRFAEDLGGLGVLPATNTPSLPPPRRALIESALDIALMPFEKFDGLFGDWTSMRIWAGLSALNVRHVMLDPELDARFAVESTADTIRRAVSLRTLARTLDVPYATAWRHCHAMKTRGVVAETEEGWVILTCHLREEHVEAQVIAAVFYYVRRLGALVKCGLDPANAAAAYIRGRPPLEPEM